MEYRQKHSDDYLRKRYISYLADRPETSMLQFTMEEMSDFCAQEGESVAPVVQFLDAHGYGFLSYPENTYKEPLASVEQEKIEMSCVIRDARSSAESIMKHPDEPRELEETYWNIAECYRQLKDKKNEEKYRLLAAATRATDEI